MRLLLALLVIAIGRGYATDVDPKGYVVFCPCMGRFGNQVDQMLGVMQFVRNLDRTLVLPNFIEFGSAAKTNMVPFEHIFNLNVIKKYQRVVTMHEFKTSIMPQIWPKEKRKAVCWTPRKSIYDDSLPVGCQAKEGSPFGPYWDKIGVDFVDDVYFGDIPGAYDLQVKGSKTEWLRRFPVDEYPVLAFSSPPAPFPSRTKTWELQRYLKWGSRVLGKARQFISDNLERPFVGVHLRNDRDWKSVCDHIGPDRDTKQTLFASAQCLGEMHHAGTLTKEMCIPSQKTIITAIVTEVGRIGAKSVFVTSDRDHLLNEINEALSAYDIEAHRLPTEDPYVALAILGQADHFIGNCVSTFSHIVKRERDVSKVSKPTSYFGFSVEKKRLEL